MSLPIIDHPEPVVIPAIAEKSFSKRYYPRIYLQPDIAGDGLLEIFEARYDPATGELYAPDAAKVAEVRRGLWSTVAAYPRVERFAGEMLSMAVLLCDLKRAEAVAEAANVAYDAACAALELALAENPEASTAERDATYSVKSAADAAVDAIEAQLQ